VELVETSILMSNTSDHTDSVECAYIGEEGLQNVVTKECAQPNVARFLTVIKDPQAPDPHRITLCEVVAVGYILPEGECVIFTII